MKLSAGAPVGHYRWEDLPSERLKEGLTRKVIIGQRMTFGQFHIRRGEAVARHSHENEQISYILSGALHLWFGAHDEHEVILRDGEVLVIPSNLPHRSVALEDTLDVDVFSPPRQDWLSGTDTYLRR